MAVPAWLGQMGNGSLSQLSRMKDFLLLRSLTSSSGKKDIILTLQAITGALMSHAWSSIEVGKVCWK